MQLLAKPFTTQFPCHTGNYDNPQFIYAQIFISSKDDSLWDTDAQLPLITNERTLECDVKGTSTHQIQSSYK